MEEPLAPRQPSRSPFRGRFRSHDGSLVLRYAAKRNWEDLPLGFLPQKKNRKSHGYKKNSLCYLGHQWIPGLFVQKPLWDEREEPGDVGSWRVEA